MNAVLCIVFPRVNSSFVPNELQFCAEKLFQDSDILLLLLSKYKRKVPVSHLDDTGTFLFIIELFLQYIHRRLFSNG